ncbi:hypothetical protein ACFWA5_33345 [Streptomyces mirabilis]|uniref:hypothetical protein n=1 Tax=Streptomyces mirabilis TaxID=68239 RepID=UPI00366064DC
MVIALPAPCSEDSELLDQAQAHVKDFVAQGLMTPVELGMLDWLTVERRALTVPELRELVADPAITEEIPGVMTSLYQRSLVKRAEAAPVRAATRRLRVPDGHGGQALQVLLSILHDLRADEKSSRRRPPKARRCRLFRAVAGGRLPRCLNGRLCHQAVRSWAAV